MPVDALGAFYDKYVMPVSLAHLRICPLRHAPLFRYDSLIHTTDTIDIYIDREHTFALSATNIVYALHYRS